MRDKGAALRWVGPEETRSCQKMKKPTPSMVIHNWGRISKTWNLSLRSKGLEFHIRHSSPHILHRKEKPTKAWL